MKIKSASADCVEYSAEEVKGLHDSEEEPYVMSLMEKTRMLCERFEAAKMLPGEAEEPHLS